MTRNTFAFLAAIAAATFSYACGSSSSSPSAPSGPAADVTIQIQGDRGTNSYAPNPTAMRVGQTVAWHNADSTAHDSTQDQGRFQSGTLNAGATSSPITMSTAGTFTYHCTIHPGMVGTITVQ
ncbi:MAG TPA: plastocyanin/azurin family copper-binding protein [Vicinamibacterales bacterium]|nr:plastocyanin/azurin family copper-binding protein [Vicinamibacterales bacterium]